MKLSQFFEALCQYPNREINHKLLDQTIQTVDSSTNDQVVIHLSNGQQIVIDCPLSQAEQILHADYQALQIFNQSLMAYFADHDLNSMTNYLSRRLAAAIFLVNADHSVLTSTSKLILQHDYAQVDFKDILGAIGHQDDNSHHFALVREAGLMVNIHWMANDYHHVGQVVFIFRPDKQQMLVNLVASYFNLFTAQKILVQAPASRANRINYSKSLELALAERTLNSPVLQDDLTDFLSKKAGKLIFVVGINRQVNEIFMRNLTMSLNQCFSNGLYCYQGDNVVILTALRSPLSRHSQILDKLHRLIDQNHLAIGVSNPLQNIADLFDSYHQANLALASTKDGLIQYREVVPQHLAEYLQNQHQLQMINPAILGLKAYDHDHHTDYFQTLLTYLLANFNVEQTAQRLNVHHNTVLYRLKKLQQLLNYRFDDPQQNASLYLSLILGNYLS